MLPNNGIPLYHHLKEIFAEQIAAGEWKAGDHIPTEVQLCATYSVSRGPVRQAIELLVREGVLARKQGKGTWVRPQKLESGLGTFYSFTTLIAAQGRTPSSRVLHFAQEAASPSVRRALSLAAGARVHRFTRLRLADAEPLILETVFVPVSRAPALTQSQVAAESLYAILQNDYGLLLVRARQSFEAVVADAYEAEMLAIAPGGPLLLLQNITYAAGDLPAVFSKAVLRGDRLRYYADLSAHTAGSEPPAVAPLTLP